MKMFVVLELNFDVTPKSRIDVIGRNNDLHEHAIKMRTSLRASGTVLPFFTAINKRARIISSAD